MVIATLTEYCEYENATLCLMHELAIKSIEIIDGKVYEKKPPPGVSAILCKREIV